ncbi:adenylyl cyclase-associated protein 1 [Schistocerca gregaria]|uniref:adenylyl cyclase-associated protein 1 n=1 Tax=Schistocerca gregaria TaxID=7010 RepID=UPI00211E466D|nr:adenylyl cyclase-associated protein 1 [Schistocerca gregaria]
MFKNCCGCKSNPAKKQKCAENEMDVYKPDETKESIQNNKVSDVKEPRPIEIKAEDVDGVTELPAKSAVIADGKSPKSDKVKQEGVKIQTDGISAPQRKKSLLVEIKAAPEQQAPEEGPRNVKRPSDAKRASDARSPEPPGGAGEAETNPGAGGEAKTEEEEQHAKQAKDAPGEAKDGQEGERHKAEEPSEVGGGGGGDAAAPGGGGDDDDEEEEPLDETEAAALRAMVPTPHPAKRSGSVPGLGAIPQWLSQEDDEVFEGGGEPPATPVGRDELALRRHRFFSDLLGAAKASVEHRVRFDPLGPTVAGPAQQAGEADGRPSSAEFEVLINRLEKVTTRLEKTVEVAESALNLRANMSVAGYNDIIQGALASYLKLSGQIGGDVASHANLVSQAFQAQLQYLTNAAQSKEPSQMQNIELLKPTSTHIQAIQEYREKHRDSPHFFHLSAVSESIAALGWVTVSPAPSPYIKEMNDASQFYSNRVLKEWREKDKTHVEWVKAWGQVLTELQQFVKQHHTTGLVWGGGKASSAAPPPPPPGLPPPPPALPTGDIAPSLDSSAQDRSALFAEINKGESITASLKRVTPDMQTHKNTALRAGPAPFKAPSQSLTTRPVTAPVSVSDKPPTFTKEGKKWMVEYQKGNHSLVVENAEMNNVVYMFKCQDSTLTVKGKINSVVLDSCKKASIVFDNLVSSIEFVNCQSVQMQVLGKVPTITIDKTDGCQMYLSPESLDVEIVSSKSSEMNVMVPKGNGDYAEFPVPEQFKTTVSQKGLQTIAVENKG